MEHTYASDPDTEHAQAEHPRRARTHTVVDTHGEGKESIPEKTQGRLAQLVGEAEVRRRVEPEVRHSAVTSGNR